MKKMNGGPIKINRPDHILYFPWKSVCFSLCQTPSKKRSNGNPFRMLFSGVLCGYKKKLGLFVHTHFHQFIFNNMRWKWEICWRARYVCQRQSAVQTDGAQSIVPSEWEKAHWRWLNLDAFALARSHERWLRALTSASVAHARRLLCPHARIPLNCLTHSENLSLAFLHIFGEFMRGKVGLDGRKRRARAFVRTFFHNWPKWTRGDWVPLELNAALRHAPDDNIKWFVSPKHCKAMTKLFLSIFIYLSELIFHVVVLLAIAVVLMLPPWFT